MDSNKITSRQNPKIKYAASLKRSRHRKLHGSFLIEGKRELERAIASKKLEFEFLLLCPELLSGDDLSKFTSLDADYYEVPGFIFESLSYRDTPDGVLAVAKQFMWPQVNGDLPDSPLIVIEGVEKPGNLGTILRTAEGAGFKHVAITDPQLDLFNPNVIRASTGIIFNLNIYQQDTKSLYRTLKSNGRKIIAITPEGKALYTNEDLTGRAALVFGSEQDGLSEFARSSSDVYCSLPMLGAADSLNLAMSAGIVMYESLRQSNLK